MLSTLDLAGQQHLPTLGGPEVPIKSCRRRRLDPLGFQKEEHLQTKEDHLGGNPVKP